MEAILRREIKPKVHCSWVGYDCPYTKELTNCSKCKEIRDEKRNK